MPDNANELKPCPFCGGKAEIKPACNFGVTMYGAGCIDDNCTATITGCRTPELAADAWNSRAGSQPLQHPHGILVTRNCNFRDNAMDLMGEFLKLIDKDERPSMLYLDATPAAGCEPTDAEVKYYSLTAGRSVALGRDPVLEAIERGDVKMRVHESAPPECSWCGNKFDGDSMIYHDDPSDGTGGTYCSMSCFYNHRDHIASLPKRESSVTVDDA